MLSILIPVFNYRMEALVSELLVQCKQLPISFELVLLDDGSKPEYKILNSSLPSKFAEVRYLENTANLGRSASRNKLVQEARGEWLWFLDCDGRVQSNAKLVETFWNQKDERTILSGGRIYSTQAPADKSKYLHWLWGAQRELLDSRKRMEDPVNNFLSNNFLVSRRLMHAVQFSKLLSGYGYEDTLFAAHCIEQGFQIKHIENPVLHEGLDSTDAFIAKIEESLINLLKLDAVCRTEGIENPLNSKLFRTFKKLNILPMFIIKPCAKFIGLVLKKRLTQGLASLFWFDVYRLVYLIQHRP